MNALDTAQVTAAALASFYTATRDAKHQPSQLEFEAALLTNASKLLAIYVAFAHHFEEPIDLSPAFVASLFEYLTDPGYMYGWGVIEGRAAREAACVYYSQTAGAGCTPVPAASYEHCAADLAGSFAEIVSRAADEDVEWHALRVVKAIYEVYFSWLGKSQNKERSVADRHVIAKEFAVKKLYALIGGWYFKHVVSSSVRKWLAAPYGADGGDGMYLDDGEDAEYEEEEEECEEEVEEEADYDKTNHGATTATDSLTDPSSDDDGECDSDWIDVDTDADALADELKVQFGVLRMLRGAALWLIRERWVAPVLTVPDLVPELQFHYTKHLMNRSAKAGKLLNIRLELVFDQGKDKDEDLLVTQAYAAALFEYLTKNDIGGLNKDSDSSSIIAALRYRARTGAKAYAPAPPGFEPIVAELAGGFWRLVNRALDQHVARQITRIVMAAHAAILASYESEGCSKTYTKAQFAPLARVSALDTVHFLVRYPGVYIWMPPALGAWINWRGDDDDPAAPQPDLGDEFEQAFPNMVIAAGLFDAKEEDHDGESEDDGDSNDSDSHGDDSNDSDSHGDDSNDGDDTDRDDTDRDDSRSNDMDGDGSQGGVKEAMDDVLAMELKMRFRLLRGLRDTAIWLIMNGWVAHDFTLPELVPELV
ncbi:hypothetical protein H9P43_008122 [Blastocladiella emersonii ATCC 22665]|nr:hypothetical protein H9P43_008122 [Blastocladiella emersonii ATCC 22665]